MKNSILILTPAVKQERTVAFNHERLDNIVADQLKIGVPNPVTDICTRTSKEVIQDSDFMTEQHKAVDEVGTYEPGSSSDKNALAL